MKLRFLFLLLFLCTFSLQGITQTKSYLQFEKRHINLGKVVKGKKVSSEFIFTNTSDEDVKIDLVSVCECTEVDWPFRPIKKGEKGKISFVFDSSKKDSSETIDLDIILSNEDPKTGNPIFEIVSYSYELIE